MVAIFFITFSVFLLPFLLILCKKNAADKSKYSTMSARDDTMSSSDQPPSSVRISCISLKDNELKSEITKSRVSDGRAQEAAINVEQMNKDYPQFEEYCKTHRCVREPEMVYKGTQICKTCHDGIMWRCLARFYLHQKYLKDGVEVQDPEGNMKKFEEKLPKFGWKWTGTDFLRIKRIKRVEQTQPTETEEEQKPRKASNPDKEKTKTLGTGDYENMAPSDTGRTKTLASERQIGKKNPYENIGPKSKDTKSSDPGSYRQKLTKSAYDVVCPKSF